jgi:hypothetical protein
MRLYIFRHTDDIPMDAVASVAGKIRTALGVDGVVFEAPVKTGAKEMSMEKLLKMSDGLLEREEPVAAVVFTAERHLDEGIPGDGPERNVGIWVRTTGDAHETFLACMHELGHVFDSDHCAKRDCLMYPYATRRTDENASLESLFCGSCLRSLRESWIYNRLLSSAKARQKDGKILPEVVSESKEAPGKAAPPDEGKAASAGTKAAASGTETGPAQESQAMGKSESGKAFPDWSLPKEEFIGKVREFFGYRD